LAEAEPAVIRSNRAELGALAGGEGDDPSADSYALTTLAVVVRTGETDFVTDGARRLHVSGGHPYQARVTAAGCAATALMAGFLAVEDDAVIAAAACLAFVAAAAETAGAQAAGPGSFVPAFIDTLYRLTPEQVGAHARIL
jgi:hydroxyethylthiazole kinase